MADLHPLDAQLECAGSTQHHGAINEANAACLRNIIEIKSISSTRYCVRQAYYDRTDSAAARAGEHVTSSLSQPLVENGVRNSVARWTWPVGLQFDATVMGRHFLWSVTGIGDMRVRPTVQAGVRLCRSGDWLRCPYRAVLYFCANPLRYGRYRDVLMKPGVAARA